MLTHPADPNILVPALFAAIPTTIAAIAGLIMTLTSLRKNRVKNERAAEAVRQRLEESVTGQQQHLDDVSAQNLEAIEAIHNEVRTNHGLKAGEYLEQIGPLLVWARSNQRQVNKIARKVGVDEIDGPQWVYRSQL